MSVVPAEYTLTKVAKQVNVRRLPVRQASDTQSYGVNGKIQITIPPDFNDLRDSYLTFYAIAPLLTGTYVRFSYPIQSFIQRATVYAGSQCIEDIVDYNVLAGIFKEASSNQSVIGPQMEGAYTDATRATQTNAGRLYAVRLRLESLTRIWPCHKLLIPLRIVLQIGDPTTYMETDGTYTSPTWSEVFYNYHVVQPSAEIDALLDASIKAGTAQIRFHSYDNYQTNSASAASQMLMLPFKRECINSIVVVNRLQSEVGNVAVTGKFTDQYSCSATLQSAYVKINSYVYPQDYYNMQYNQGYYMLALPLNSIMNDDFSAHARQGDTFSDASPVDRVVIPFDLRDDSSPSGQNTYGNGVNTSASGNAQTLNMTFSGASGAISTDVFAKYEVILTVLPLGGMSLSS